MVQIWDGEAVLAATGPGAGAALSAAAAYPGQVGPELDADLDLLSRRSLDVLPRSAPARRAVEARRQVVHLLRPVDDARLPPALVALPGALADEMLRVLTGQQGVEAALAGAGGVLAVSGRGMAVPAGRGRNDLAVEFYETLGKGAAGGLAISGLAGPHPIVGLADITACAAGTAADAAMAAAVLADAVGLGSDGVGMVTRRESDEPGFRGVAVTKTVEQMVPDLIWEALSAGMRRASAFRQARLISAAVLTLKGRGRVAGSVDADRLLRFGVSEWG